MPGLYMYKFSSFNYSLRWDMLKFFYPAVIYLILVCAPGCNTPSSQEIDISAFGRKSDTLIQNVSAHLNENTRLLDEKQRYDSSLRLQSLLNGVEGLEIRILLDQYYEQELYVFKYNQSKASGKYFSTRMGYEKGNDSIYLIKERLISPSTGWVSFFDKLKELTINELPDQSELEGFEFEVCSRGVLIELATNNYYKSVQYCLDNPSVENTIQHQAVVEFLDILRKEF